MLGLPQVVGARPHPDCQPLPS